MGRRRKGSLVSQNGWKDSWFHDATERGGISKSPWCNRMDRKTQNSIVTEWAELSRAPDVIQWAENTKGFIMSQNGQNDHRFPNVTECG